jgi:hypothetical protein
MRVANMAWSGAMLGIAIAMLGVGCFDLNSGLAGNDTGGNSPDLSSVTGTGGDCPCVKNGVCGECDPDAAGLAAGQDDPSAPPSNDFGQCPIPTGEFGSNVSRVPENTRTFDSAAYAHALLEEHLAPDPTTVRLSDFENWYAYYPTQFDPTTSNVSVDVSVTEDLKSGAVIGRFATPPAGSRKPLGLVIVLDTSPSTQHSALRALQLASAEALINGLSGTGDDAVVRTWTSDPLAKLPDALTLLHSAEDPGSEVLPSDASNDLASMLETALTDTTKLQIPDGGDKHVVIFTDGGASAVNAAHDLSAYNKAGVTLDVIHLAQVGTLLKDGYNASLLATLARPGGARLLITDRATTAPGETSPYADVNALIGRRFDELFGRAYDSLRVTFSIPGSLHPLTVEVAAPTGAPETLNTAETTPLRAVSVGPGRLVTIREAVTVDPAMVDSLTLFGTCGDRAVVATFSTNIDEQTQSAFTATQSIGTFANSTAEANYDQAIVAFVSALRSGGLLAPDAQAAVCAALAGCATIGSPAACSNLTEMQTELELWAPPSCP